MRITGDNPEGKAELDTFIDPEGDHPVIVTTSRLLTTGVDAKTCKLIVLDRRIGSMTEFKQIIGRGTRVDEDYGKYFFTIMDFKKATENFADPDFDGPPICIYEPQEGEDVVPPDEIMDNDEKDETTSDDSTVVDDDYTGGEEIDPVDPPIIDITGIKPKKYYVNDIPVTIVAERVQYFDPTTGKLITESLKDYTRTRVSQDYESLDAFLQDWNAADKKQVILDEMEEHGVFFEALADEVGQDFDPFDLICHVAFDQPPLTRQERAEGVRKRDYFTRYGEEARGVLQALLEKYADEGPAPLEDMTILKISPFSQYGTPTEIIKLFGSREKYLKAIHDMQALLYETA